MEVEQNKQIPFLDVLVRRNEDGTLSHRIYRKPTHTDRYLHAISHHHPAQKKSVISFLVYRALKISETASLDEELEHLNRTSTNNGYESKDINRVTYKLKNKISDPNNTQEPKEERVKTESPEEEREKDKTVVLPHLRGIIERIGRNLNKHNIRVIFKTPIKISQLLPNRKTRNHTWTPGVYKIPCACGKIYIGETGKRISTRIKECDVPNTVTFLNLPWLNTG
ncbi:uncharacterized protein LOC112588648 isoform X1 [Harpegnathos saltator]|uniref:uncharacterized protein LOC112588648 isoform X1 n=1 Tax=Harpegnathos saltator TaxID=610380 RepID=UPI000DBEE111|nr:uncharacterized protein LOC112588648 isoform X1 [Harpegnathos saltator]XP_025155085.1 uncharacterized protein LOC112588648 isoform X1 [Harpegnathos saltator]